VAKTQYLSQKKHDSLVSELEEIRKTKMPETAIRIDEARQMGDLSENAEYHDALDQMGSLAAREKQIEGIFETSEILSEKAVSGIVQIGNTIEVEVNEKKRTYTIVGAQEADPLEGKISNESPLGEAFLEKQKGDKVTVNTPKGEIEYEILSIS